MQYSLCTPETVHVQGHYRRLECVAIVILLELSGQRELKRLQDRSSVYFLFSIDSYLKK